MDLASSKSSHWRVATHAPLEFLISAALQKIHSFTACMAHSWSWTVILGRLIILYDSSNATETGQITAMGRISNLGSTGNGWEGSSMPQQEI